MRLIPLLIFAVCLMMPLSVFAVYTEGDVGSNVTPTTDDTAILPRRVTLPIGAVMVYGHS